MIIDPDKVVRMNGARRLASFTGIALVWALLSTWVGWHAVGTGFPDGFQSLGPIFGRQPGHLTWPMLGGFEGFDRSWGYHWAGWPMLRSLIGFVAPWTALGDGLVLHLMRAALAVWVGGCLFKQFRSEPAAWIGLLTVLLNRGWFCSMAFLYRPETITALLLWIAARPLIGKREDTGRFTHVLSVLSLVLLPLMHPLAWPASLLLAGIGSLTIRARIGTSAWIWKSCLLLWLPAMLGIWIFAAYYLADPLRLAQLKDTLQTTASMKSGIQATAQRLFLDPKNIFFSGPTLAVLGLSGLAACRRPQAMKAWLFDGYGLSVAMVLLSLLYLLVAGHPNTGHATVMAPFLGYAAGRLFELGWKSTAERRLVRLAMTGQAMACSVPLALTALSFISHPPASPRARAAAVLDRALASTPGRVIIPLSLWEAAGAVSVKDLARIRFVTFPNWVPLDRRLAYERDLEASLGEGDVLIADGTPPDPSDPENILPWPRTSRLRGEGGWVKIGGFDAIVNTTLSLGILRREEMLLGPMTLLRYQAAR
jgi:hypothetical protein